MGHHTRHSMPASLLDQAPRHCLLECHPPLDLKFTEAVTHQMIRRLKPVVETACPQDYSQT